MGELTNRLYPADDLSGAWDGSFADRIWNHEGVRGKVDLIQRRLIQALKTRPAAESPCRGILCGLPAENQRRGRDFRPGRQGPDTANDPSSFSSKKYVGVSPKTLAGDIVKTVCHFARFSRTSTS